MKHKVIRFGIIGCGLMGREFASAIGRWCHLLDMKVTPQLTAICDTNPETFDWYQTHFPGIKLATKDASELLASKDVDAVYCAVPHHLHADLYCDIIRAGKHLLGEKPFGIDAEANQQILAEIKNHPDITVRCSSEFPFFPVAQRIIRAAQSGSLGRIIEVQAGLHHCSDLNPEKPLNWKRKIAFNGAYGCMGDLGMHALHIPFRLGWLPQDVYAQCSNIITERPDGQGGMAPCETWDNAQLNCNTLAPECPHPFPMTITTKRISPGDTNTWFLRVIGTSISMEFSSRYPKTLRSLAYTSGGSQAWTQEELGCDSVFPTITGNIFEFGFSDAILQMWGAFCMEVAHGPGAVPFGCVTPKETLLQHQLLTAALASQEKNQVVKIES